MLFIITTKHNTRTPLLCGLSDACLLDSFNFISPQILFRRQVTCMITVNQTFTCDTMTVINYNNSYNNNLQVLSTKCPFSLERIALYSY